MDKTVVIIGGGMGGLFTGAFLSKEGLKVTVLEKNPIIGGGLQCFKRHGVSFETGMHILGGFNDGGSLTKICNYLGILDKLSIMHTDDDAIDSITYGEDGSQYNLPKGKEAFTAYLQEQFPSQTENIQRYMDALYALSEEVDLFYLRKGDNSIFSHSDEFVMPADEFIAKYITDYRLRDLLAYMSPMYGGVAGHTPAYIHAMINVLYINGSSQFVDGSQQLADTLADVICTGGGKVVPGDAVSRIVVNGRSVERVETTKGNTYRADWYISDVHPTVLFQLTGDSGFPCHFINRVKQIPNSCSAFTVYIKFKPDSQPYVNHPRYYQESYGTVWKMGNYDEDTFPQGFMYITPPAANQGKWAGRMIVNCLMPFDCVRRWEDTRVGHRGESYERWKDGLKKRIIAKLEELHPGFSDTIEVSFASSPLTIRDYFNVKEGSLYGHQCDCKNILVSQVSIVTKVSNLLLTGQNVNLHGICGVPLTALETAEVIVGRGKILDKINIINQKQN